MLAGIWRGIGRVHLVLAALGLCLMVCEPTVRRYGDKLQVALPLVAWACAATDGRGAEVLARFAGVFVVAHGTKAALGQVPLNRRPSGGDSGFPSAHTAAAVFGASSIVHDCVARHPVARALVVMAAAFVGGSRIEVRAHDIWQVLAGGLLGWGGDRLLRRDSALRRRVVVGAVWLGRGLGRRLLPMAGRMRRGLAALLLPLVLLVLPADGQAETELSLYSGLQAVQDSRLSGSAAGDVQVQWEGQSLKAPPYYGLRLTRWRPDGLGYGIEVNHAKAYADDPARHGYDRLEFSDGLNIVTANLWHRWPGVGRRGLQPYLGAGIGLAVPHVDIQPTGGAHTFGYQITGPAAQLVAGARLPLSGRWALFGEWKGSWSKHKVDLDSGGTLRTEIVTHALNVGLSYRF